MTKKGISESVQKDGQGAPQQTRVKKGRTSDTTEPAPSAVQPPKPGCTLYIGRLPHGFFEDEMRGYFSQFGQVTRLRLSRNKTTGAPKHYGYIEFQHPEVAKIVAETMHNYLLFGHLIQCRLVPDTKLHPELFKGANRKFVKIPWRRMAQNQYNKRGEKSSDLATELQENARRIERVRQRCVQAGIDYDFDSVVRTKISAP